MKSLILSCALSVVVGVSYAQSVVPPNIRATNTLERLNDLDGLGMGDLLYGIPLPEGKVVGDTYLATHWQMSSILLYEKDKMIEGYPVRYDIYVDEIEIKTKNGIKALQGSKIKRFVWIDSVTRKPAFFVNAKDYTNENNVPFTGFFQVLTEGEMPLFKKTYIDIKKADYNIQLNVGSQDDKILKKSEFYWLKGNDVVEIPASKKKLLPLFGDKAEDIEKFMKENNLSANKEADLKLLFEHYSSL